MFTYLLALLSEPVWPSGEALVRLVNRRTSAGSIPLRLSSLFKKLWSVDTVL